MNETHYLVDNNALTAIRAHRIRSQFFRHYCYLTADVLREAQGHPEEATLAANASEITPEIIEGIRQVMTTLEADDTSLVDLYKNKGAADPGLIAWVIDSIAADDGKLFRDEWILVSNDRAVLKKAAEFRIATMRPEELARRIDLSIA